MLSFINRAFKSPRRRASSNRYLRSFQKEIESGLAAITKDITDQWFKDTEQELRQSMTSLLDSSLKSSISQWGNANGAGSGNQTGSWESSLNNTVERLLLNIASDILNKKETKTTQGESERSKTAASASLKLSRAQQQAMAAREVSKGRRNL
jgi:hypothetical protein